jgi:phosphoribosylanthranilate isomerase
MGLIFYDKSPRFVNKDFGTTIKKTALKKVGVFVNEDLKKVLEISKEFELSGIQLHGDEDWEYVKELRGKTTATLFKAYSVSSAIDWKILEPYNPFVDYYLFDTATSQYGGSGKTFNWSLLENYPFQTPFFLSGGISEEHLDEIEKLGKKVSPLKGVDINSKFEIEPGLKDVNRISLFQKQLEKIKQS